MRTIKFRGKDILTDKWIYGDLLHLGNAYAIVTSYEEEELEVNPISYRLEFRVEDIAGVYPETVGQFTGLLDKNGKEIYEGDIIQFQFTQSSSCSSKLFLSEQFIGIITIDKWNNHIIKSNGLEIHIYNACEYGVVIGNIHDTPELLKGGEE